MVPSPAFLAGDGVRRQASGPCRHGWGRGSSDAQIDQSHTISKGVRGFLTLAIASDAEAKDDAEANFKNPCE